MGDCRPWFIGIGLFGDGFSFEVAGSTALLAFTSSVNLASLSASGILTIDTTPFRSAKLRPAGSAWGAMEPKPYPLAIRSWRSSTLSVTAAGYQPVGMNPRGWGFFELRSTTAMALLLAFATYRVLSSVVTANAFGELPSGALRTGETAIVPVTLSVLVSITETVSLLAFATYRWPPFELKASALGCRPTSISASTWPDWVLMTETVPVDGIPVRGSTTTGFIPSVVSFWPGNRPPQLLT